MTREPKSRVVSVTPARVSQGSMHRKMLTAASSPSAGRSSRVSIEPAAEQKRGFRQSSAAQLSSMSPLRWRGPHLGVAHLCVAHLRVAHLGVAHLRVGRNQSCSEREPKARARGCGKNLTHPQVGRDASGGRVASRCNLTLKGRGEGWNLAAVSRSKRSAPFTSRLRSCMPRRTSANASSEALICSPASSSGSGLGWG